MRCRPLPGALVALAALWALLLPGPLSPARAQQPSFPYTIDVLSDDYYPQLRDSWMYFINNQGVAAGQTDLGDPHSGPFLPTTYTGHGQFHTFGIESSHYQFVVTGISDNGIVVGDLSDPDYNFTGYLYRDGKVEYPTAPAGSEDPLLDGISHTGVAYGSVLDSASGAIETITIRDDDVDILPLSAPGFFHFFAGGPRLLSDAGLLSVTGYSQDFSVNQNFLYDIPTGALSTLAVPDGFDQSFIAQVTGSGLVFGQVSTADFSQSRLGFWNADGSFRDFFDVPEGLSSIVVNDLGQAVGLKQDQLMFYDGTSWRERDVLGLNGYSLAGISDFNDHGQFVGLASNPQGSWLWGFVATPVPEPGSLALLAPAALLGLAGVLARRRRA